MGTSAAASQCYTHRLKVKSVKVQSALNCARKCTKVLPITDKDGDAGLYMYTYAGCLGTANWVASH